LRTGGQSDIDIDFHGPIRCTQDLSMADALMVLACFWDHAQKMKAQTPRFFRGVSPQPQQSFSRAATPLIINGHEDSTFNTNPATTRAGVAMYQDLNPLTTTPNGNSNIFNYSQNRVAMQNSNREVSILEGP
jgi:hypothetical protein